MDNVYEPLEYNFSRIKPTEQHLDYSVEYSEK